ncbi:iron-containing alcohol dehydrogenase [Streptomyces sp. NPDC005181]|uniref:iron-containing alcohol dehydrogenase n=1 Tax=Streptomyces sp. NPDC005181 TaxID=3156869 RepID=UPI0033B98993
MLAGGLRDSGVARREQLLYGSYSAGSAFAVAGSGLHHKICHALGGTFDLPHAGTHTAVLPHVLAFNVEAAAEAGGGAPMQFVKVAG